MLDSCEAQGRVVLAIVDRCRADLITNPHALLPRAGQRNLTDNQTSLEIEVSRFRSVAASLSDPLLRRRARDWANIALPFRFGDFQPNPREDSRAQGLNLAFDTVSLALDDLLYEFGVRRRALTEHRRWARPWRRHRSTSPMPAGVARRDRRAIADALSALRAAVPQVRNVEDFQRVRAESWSGVLVATDTTLFIVHDGGVARTHWRNRHNGGEDCVRFDRQGRALILPDPATRLVRGAGAAGLPRRVELHRPRLTVVDLLTDRLPEPSPLQVS
jgi:hypothetical protein